MRGENFDKPFEVGGRAPYPLPHERGLKNQRQLPWAGHQLLFCDRSKQVEGRAGCLG